LEKQVRAYGATTEVSVESKTEPVITVTRVASEVKLRLWYCKQCGYVVFREEPPYICPICKAKKDMFSEITVHIDIRG